MIGRLRLDQSDTGTLHRPPGQRFLLSDGILREPRFHPCGSVDSLESAARSLAVKNTNPLSGLF